MKKIKFFSLWLLLTVSMATVVCNSYGQTSNTTDKGVIINGVKWATRNVDIPGTFAASPERAGKFYQWNRKKAWPTTGAVSGWNSSTPAGTSWTKANDPSPAGWRVPTLDEIKTLLDKEKVSNEWVTVNGVDGRRFTDKVTGNSIFLPSAGVRHINGMSLKGPLGFYLSNTRSGSSGGAYNLAITPSAAASDNINVLQGNNIRCVAEEAQTQNAVKEDRIGKTIKYVEQTLKLNFWCTASISGEYDAFLWVYTNKNKDLYLFLAKTGNDEDYIIVDELIIDGKTTDLFDCGSAMYDTKKIQGNIATFVRYKTVNKTPILVNVYDCKDGKIIPKAPSEKVIIQFYEP